MLFISRIHSRVKPEILILTAIQGGYDSTGAARRFYACAASATSNIKRRIDCLMQSAQNTVVARSEISCGATTMGLVFVQAVKRSTVVHGHLF